MNLKTNWNKYTRLLVTAAGLSASLIASVNSHALSIKLSDNTGNQAIINDVDGDGAINTFTSIGQWNFVSNIAMSYPFIGTPDNTQIYNQSTEATFAGSPGSPASLTIEITHTGFNTQGSADDFVTNISANQLLGVGSYDFDLYLDSSNAAFGRGDNEVSFDTDTGGFHASSFSSNFNTSPYSVTMVTTVELEQAGVAGFTWSLREVQNSSVSVSEPSALALFVLGIAGLVVGRRRA